MFGQKKSPLHRFSNHHSGDPKVPDNPISNPFGSDDETDSKQSLQAARRTSSDPSPMTPNSSLNPFDDDEIKGTSSSKPFLSSADRNKYNNDFRDSGGLENQSVQELEDYAVYKAEETTNTVNSCLKIAEDMKDEATKTLITLHQQGEQITRTHLVAADIDHDLSRGEKLMGSLGGIISKTWKPKKTRPIAGPVIVRDDPVQRKGNHLEQRQKLGLTHTSKEISHSRTPPNEPTNTLQKVEFEKAKQDDSLSDLSNILGELKHMAIDMGSEIERQTKAIDNVQDDVEVLNTRVKGVTQRGRRLLGK
ncbi:SNAP25 homologous protein SNAP33-like [Primulina eburnea]|uniref:SNAP25 homologous protein SNAP33-like n=1 Tax=Primulina eburnea TaxID=1245227 RepID=UPI003C6C877E